MRGNLTAVCARYLCLALSFSRFSPSFFQNRHFFTLFPGKVTRLSIVCVFSLLYFSAVPPYNTDKRYRKGEAAVIDKRIGKRVKQCREQLGLSQEDFAEKTGLTANYISTVERGMSFPRCENLITLINGLEVSADAIFCDVLQHSCEYQTSELSKRLASLPPEAQKRILQMVELMIKQENFTAT